MRCSALLCAAALAGWALGSVVATPAPAPRGDVAALPPTGKGAARALPPVKPTTPLAERRAAESARAATVEAASAAVTDDAAQPGPAPQPQIKGGTLAARDEFPFMVALLRAFGSNQLDRHYCGGSLVAPQWVLTAAHCVDQTLPSQLQVAVGLLNLDGDVPGQYELRNVVDIIVHPRYTPIPWEAVNAEDPGFASEFDYDVALLLLDVPVTTKAPVEMVREPDVMAPGTPGTVVGWGDTGGGTYLTQLRKVTFPIVSNTTANNAWGGAVSTVEVAAGTADGNTDSCSGDSGGPLLVPAPGGGWQQAGVVSWGASGCGVTGFYSVYARLTALGPWLRAQMQGTWAQATEDPADYAPLADRDGDGRSNLADFAFGTDLGAAGPATADGTTVTYTAEWAATAAGPWQTTDLVAGPRTAADHPRLRAASVTATHPSARLVRVGANLNPAVLPKLADLDTEGWRQFFGPTIAGQSPRTFFFAAPAPGTLNVQFVTTGGTIAVAAAEAASDTFGPDGTYSSSGRFANTAVTATEAGQLFKARVTFPTGGAYRLGVWHNPGLPAATTFGEIQGTLTSAEDNPTNPYPGDYYKTDYLLNATNFAIDYTLTTTLDGDTYDPVLQIIDAATGRMLLQDDDGATAGGLNSKLRVPSGNIPRIVRVTSARDLQTGSFTLAATTVTPVTLTTSTTASGTLAAGDFREIVYTSDRNPDGSRVIRDRYYDDYQFRPQTSALASYTATISSVNGFTPIVYIIDATNGYIVEVINGIDDETSKDFKGLMSHTYVLRVTSEDYEDTGSYSLRVR